jgi:hypothetical protein
MKLQWSEASISSPNFLQQLHLHDTILSYSFSLAEDEVPVSWEAESCPIWKLNKQQQQNKDDRIDYLCKQKKRG